MPSLNDQQPGWVCYSCGTRYGVRAPVAATWGLGICGCCGRQTDVTQPRDFGYLKPAWKVR